MVQNNSSWTHSDLKQKSCENYNKNIDPLDFTLVIHPHNDDIQIDKHFKTIFWDRGTLKRIFSLKILRQMFLRSQYFTIVDKVKL